MRHTRKLMQNQQTLRSNRQMHNQKMLHTSSRTKPLRLANNQIIPTYLANPANVATRIDATLAIRFKIAIIQTACWGDNINSTLMHKPLTQHYMREGMPPHIDIYTTTRYADAFYHNEYISNIFEFECVDKTQALEMSLVIPPLIVNSGYDLILNPHPYYNKEYWVSHTFPDWPRNIILAWVRALENCEVPITEVQSHLVLNNAEMQRIEHYTMSIPDFDFKFKNLMEHQSESGQSFWDDEWTYAVGKELCQRDELLFISGKDRTPATIKLLQEYPTNAYFVGHLSIRECTELFNKCDRFFAVSSGLCNACGTDRCKHDIQWVETVSDVDSSSYPLRATNKLFWHEQDLPKFLREAI